MKFNKSYWSAISGAQEAVLDTIVAFWLCSGSGAKEAEGGGIPVQEGGVAYGSDLSVAEKAAQGHLAQVLAEDAGIEVG